MVTVTKERLHLLYPAFAEQKDFYLGRITAVEKGFWAQFGQKPVRLFSAPGRTEIGGNHTDHQQGCVLAASVDLDVLAAAAPNGTTVVRVLSEGYPLSEVDLSDLSVRKEEENTSEALVRGMAKAMEERGKHIQGFDLYATSNVLKGSGLSSSAAYEVLLGTVMNGLFCDGVFTDVEIAQMGQFAENVYFGKPSGLMDQMASSVGNIVAIDFADKKNPQVRRVDFDFEQTGHCLCIVDSGADHADLTDAYSAIPKEMKDVAAFFGKDVLREVDEEAFFAALPQVRQATGDRAVLRAIHFFADSRRAQQEAEALEQGDFDQFLQLVCQSGQSSFQYLQNISVEGAVAHQEVAVALAVCEKALGGKGAFRVHGGGFAGTIMAFVPQTDVEGFQKTMEERLAPGCCHVLHIRAVGGVEIWMGE